MADTYDIFLGVRVEKTTSKEVMVDDEFCFAKKNFAGMANHTDEFYTLIEKLQKIK